MKRVLMLASVASMIDQFNMSNIRLLKELGYEVDVACNFEYGNTCSQEKIDSLKKRLDQDGIRYFQIDFTRKVLNLKQDYVAYCQVKKLLAENCYEFIHCHSPIGGVVGRLAGRRAKVKVIYTAHGFHFYQGAPLLNWLIFYPIEKWLARYTDVLITMNEEDHQRAIKKLRAKRIEYIHGVGIDTAAFDKQNVDCTEKRNQMGIPRDATVLLSVGELNDNKNHAVVIKALKEINNPSCHYVICGKGEEEKSLEQLAKEVGVEKQLHLLGFRADVAKIYAVADIFLFPSKREGLPVALMEAMASGLPVVASQIRGNTDLVLDGTTGYLVPFDDVQAYTDRIEKLLAEPEMREKMGEEGRSRVQKFDQSRVCREMRKIYQDVVMR